ncbi:putative receptor-like protein kinase [Morus notabilis]|uniref:non-specific serine/threonine protein kinase n=1 Tax=Morus notabilis TaxID=981085 RepID=W9RG21_9ROSA|nr:LEAF RUST 10 DISEASE-RESISTANCE LOCUS RECEPTOR-LIKE PROTEIN KINASE-like 2.5 [Morus notabilis]EXB88612.1 putative receptor-like protein kinase [Morus notabilis]
MELQFFFKSLFAATFILITTFPSSRCKENENFSACTQPYECGDIKNLYFPFWGDGRPEICGHPGFNLSCVNNEYPVIHIQGLDYRLLNVSREINTMTLARLDLWDNPCSPDTSKNTTLDDIVAVNYPPTVVNLTLIYNCTKPEESLGQYFPNNFSCPKDDDRISYYVRNESQLQDLETEGLIRDRRGGVIQVPVFRIALDEIERSAADGVHSVLIKGFDVNYMEFPLCSECEWSSGRCGSNNSNGMVTCYCSGGREYLYVCPHSSGRDWKLKTGIGIVSGGSALLLIGIITCWCRCSKSKKSLTKKTQNDQEPEAFIRSYGHLTAKRYSFFEVEKMTKSFKDKLGQGGFGEVYKGKLLDGRHVAVKILNASKGNGEEFINEVASISRTSHVNIVTLLGFCLDGRKRALIYEFMPNGSLEKFTYKDNPSQTTTRLEWEKQLQICIGIARGLEYLHRGCNTKILHLDIKPHNILLDEDLCPKIADFGLAKLCPRNESIISMAGTRGTIGYIAPEVFSRNFGGVSSKSDVYSYGMMILEVVGGRKNIKVGLSDTSEIYFPDWIYKHLKQGSNLQLWRDMTSEENEIARKMILVGLWCIQTKSSDRPSMTKVIEMLEGSVEALHLPPNPSLFAPKSPERLPLEPFPESSTTSTLW